MSEAKKLFAFKLAGTAAKGAAKATKWTARTGVSLAGCTDQTGDGDYRADIDIWGTPRGRDNGYWC